MRREEEVDDDKRRDMLVQAGMTLSKAVRIFHSPSQSVFYIGNLRKSRKNKNDKMSDRNHQPPHILLDKFHRSSLTTESQTQSQVSSSPPLHLLPLLPST